MHPSKIVAPLALVLLPASAFGLAQSKHKALSYNACRSAHLPMDFCEEVGAAAYNVDHYEWDLLAAHAQPEEGQSQCDAANAVTGRVQALAVELGSLLTAPGATGSRESLEEIATAFGRVLHTIQDNCAHSGMPNTEHAWFSLSDSCLDTESSPDIQPAAQQCAEKQTLLAVDSFVTAYENAALTTSSFEMYKEPNEQVGMYWPSRGGVCEFLKGADAWDGLDRRWNNDLMVPALENQLYTSLVVDPAAPPTDVCAGDPNTLAITPAEPVDVSQKIAWCTSIQLYCVGKGDGTDSAPPWEDAASAPAAASSGESESSGCNIRGAPSDSPWPAGLVAALGLLVGISRRRR